MAAINELWSADPRAFAHVLPARTMANPPFAPPAWQWPPHPVRAPLPLPLPPGLEHIRPAPALQWQPVWRAPWAVPYPAPLGLPPGLFPQGMMPPVRPMRPPFPWRDTGDAPGQASAVHVTGGGGGPTGAPSRKGARANADAFRAAIARLDRAFASSIAEGDKALGQFAAAEADHFALHLRADTHETVLGNDLDFGRFEAGATTDPVLKTLRVYNTSEQARSIVGVFYFPQPDEISLHLENFGMSRTRPHAYTPSKDEPVQVRPRSVLELRIVCRASTAEGLKRVHVFVAFDNGLILSRKVLALMAKPAVNGKKSLDPRAAEYVPQRAQTGTAIHTHVAGEPPPVAMPPGPTSAAASSAESLRESLRRLKTLSPETYYQHFSTLVEAEDFQMRRDIRAYDIPSAELRKDPARVSLYTLHVPGLLESRPPIGYGDLVYLFSEGVAFDAYVHAVDRKKEMVWLSVGSGHLRPASDSTYYVQFTVNHQAMYEVKRALSFASPLLTSQFAFLRRRLFPTAADFTGTWRNGLRLHIDPPFPFDWDQRKAIQAIVYWEAHLPLDGAPFVLHGPPGTGKTCVIVETVAQILLKKPDARILVAAPSNAAADVLCARLATRLKSEISQSPRMLFRLNSHTRFIQEVPRQLLAFCHIDNSSGFFAAPPLDDLQGRRVVVSTCVSAGLLVNAGIDFHHFAFIFVDECAQATEPEALVPLSLAGPSCRVVLSGDHSQLGPSIRSNVCISLGLGMSLQERIMRRYVAFEHEANGNVHCPHMRLSTNFRSHGPMLSVPSALFYGGEIEVAPDADDVAPLPWLPNPRFPLVFYAVQGEDIPMGSSVVSYSNPIEALLIADIVERVYESFGNAGDTAGPHDGRDDVSGVATGDVVAHGRSQERLLQSDIGVISPFRAQVKLIRQLLRNRSLSGVDVGTVEDYQGQERKIVVVSTVRSHGTWLAYDRRSGMGLLNNSKRFNVAITRARSLLIAVGNPAILALDANWRAFLSHCAGHGSVMGAAPSGILDSCAKHATPNEGRALLRAIEKKQADAAAMSTLAPSRCLGAAAEGEDEAILTPDDEDADAGFDDDGWTGMGASVYADDKEWRYVL